jgi:hypothetical protein
MHRATGISQREAARKAGYYPTAARFLSACRRSATRLSRRPSRSSQAIWRVERPKCWAIPTRVDEENTVVSAAFGQDVQILANSSKYVYTSQPKKCFRGRLSLVEGEAYMRSFGERSLRCALIGACALASSAYGQDPNSSQLSMITAVGQPTGEEARQAAEKETIADSIIAREEAASGRALDPGFRAQVKADLRLRSFEQLETVQKRGRGLFPIPSSLVTARPTLSTPRSLPAASRTPVLAAGQSEPEQREALSSPAP